MARSRALIWLPPPASRTRFLSRIWNSGSKVATSFFSPSTIGGTMPWQAVRSCVVTSNSVGLPFTGSIATAGSTRSATEEKRSLTSLTIWIVNWASG